MNSSLQIKRIPYANIADLFAGDDVRVLYVGDIHGEIHRLHKLLAQMNFNSNRDVLISVGDIFDRGKQSLQTLQYFYGCDRDHIMSVMGNHEHTSSKLIRFGLPLKQWFTNGGGWLSELYDDIEVFNQTKKMIVSYASMLPYAITVYHRGMRIGVVHAEVDYEAPHWNVFRDSLEAENSFVVESALWSREIINCPERFDKPEFRVKGVDWTIHGHTPIEDPIHIQNRLYIDTGAVFKGGKLTILEFDSNGQPTYTFG